MSLVKVLFDFEAHEAGELSVDAGEVVRVSKMSQMPLESGWVMVETTKSPLTKGYVPSGYLSEPLDEDQRQANLVGAKLGDSPGIRKDASGAGLLNRSISADTANRKQQQGSGSRIRRLSDPRLPHYLSETFNSISQTGKTPTLPLPLPMKGQSQNNGVTLFNGGNAQHNTTSLVEFRRGKLEFKEEKVSEEELQRMLQRNDQWHSQVMDARARKQMALETGLTRLKKCLSVAREKSQDLGTQLNQLETELEHKRNKWQRKQEEAERELAEAAR